MNKILILGASGSLAKVVIPKLLKNPDNQLTLFVRNPNSVAEFAGEKVQIIQGDVLDFPALDAAMSGQEMVYAGLAGSLEKMADNVVKTVQRNQVKHLIWISSMGIYGETGENHGSVLDPYRKSAQLIENSDVPYTIIRPAWFTDGQEIDYQTTQKGEPFKGTSVSRASIADLIEKIIANPDEFKQKSVGIGRV
ncbi:NAD-dependent dehydratase [Actinobacillus succinogenes]|uniref:NAD-dependent epimerase/dehydratase n=1 Tax=Actinobacillus succinogenes (strain ATCC 55618 / DSM 22257 / CCUG 43843 / 130Z) TaxID=339671 RepID=A6VR35_ACTSZ|nr:NAD(P)H-binding protein [Actinobacillus succinogenes]ABR75432.1 NAD-dependent epimerase/dehydratase [Actinobacillus succinogenes 130Z]PHI40180.1 NAD-dependent dehydratase [Actinobacillus succinogenes]